MKRLQHPIGQVLDHIPILPKVTESRNAIKILDSIVYKIISDRRQMNLQTENMSNNNNDILINTNTNNNNTTTINDKIKKDENKTEKQNNNKQKIRKIA
jgi:hypothetical protein